MELEKKKTKNSNNQIENAKRKKETVNAHEKRKSLKKSKLTDEKQNCASESETEKRREEPMKKTVVKVKEEKETLEMTLINAAKKEASDAKRKSNRLFKKCVAEIKKMTEEHLPRKPRSTGGKVKVCITVPSNKKGGDTITFSNPHLPSQKLKVQIPENSKPGETFKVSVPMPKVSKPGNLQNKFTKGVINALDDYSKASDYWCQAEAKRRSLQPKKKGGMIEHFKAGVERLKKYDDMLEEFPINLAVPIDATALRKLVRRNRQNTNKRMKTLAATTEITETAKKDTHRKSMKLTVPGKGLKFISFKFDDADFERKEM